MVDAVATVALETLRDLLIKEVKFIYGVRTQIDDAERNLQEMHSFLKDIDKIQNKYNYQRVRNWVLELKSLATKAEDVLDRYAVEITSSKTERENNGLKKLLNRYCCILGECCIVYSVGKEMEGIMSRVAKLTKKLKSISDEVIAENDDNQRLLRQTYGHGIEEHFVGMKDDINLLLSHMKNDERAYRVVSICGMGGSGKTTLARKIYQHDDVRYQFEAHAWVCVTQQFQAKSVLQEILKQLLPEDERSRVKKMEEVELVKELYNIQKVKKCLVVLDDIWEVDQWNILSPAFPYAESNSKIMVTTRNQRIVEEECVHNLECFSEDESWDLLKRIALPNGEQGLSMTQSNQFENIGRIMVNKCGCLPLAVSVIGGLLRGKRYLSEWDRVDKNLDSCLKHREGAIEKDKRIGQVLKLSYDTLPYYLKLCFSYLGCFPEDKDIHVEEVYLVWMAEGMVSLDDSGRNETLRDIAERYLSELASRCMVQVTPHESSTYRKFQTCRLHDLMRDLCLSNCETEEFLEVVDSHVQHRASNKRIRRLAIELGKGSIQSYEQFKNKRLRSLILQNNDLFDEMINCQNLSNFDLKYVKILILYNCAFEDRKLHIAVGKLMLLKHLSVKFSLVDELPQFVCLLPFVQSMELLTKCTITLPDSINEMRRLKHLFLPTSVKILGDGKLNLDGLNELETLVGFHSKFFHSKPLLKLTNLRRFDGVVNDMDSLSVAVDHFANLQDQLREIRLSTVFVNLSSEEGQLLLGKVLIMCGSLNYLSIWGQVIKLPAFNPHEHCQNLLELELMSSGIEEDPMETLQLLPMLRTLSLSMKAFVGTEMVCGGGGFPELKSLYFSALPNLVEWRVERNSMPKLFMLRVNNCQKYEAIPDGLRFVASLKELRISNMPNEFLDRLRKEGEDYTKVSHVPFIALSHTNL